jgi:hypothetical protein
LRPAPALQVHRIEPYDFVRRRQQRRRAVVNRLGSLTVLMLLALRLDEPISEQALISESV